MTPHRLITDDHGHERPYRRCNACRSWKPADTGFYPDRGTCRPCKRAQVNADRANRRKHPESRAAMRARDAQYRQAYKRRHPERVRAQQRERRRRYYQANREQVNENARINYRLRKEQAGQPVGHGKPARIAPYRPPGGFLHSEARLDPQPLREWILAVRDRTDDFKALCRSLEFEDRQLRRLLSDEQHAVSLHTADRLLTHYNRPIVIRSRDLEARLVEWAQGLPGNGARLLRYMDRAEAVAHLADRTILTLDDLWPEA